MREERQPEEPEYAALFDVALKIMCTPHPASHSCEARKHHCAPIKAGQDDLKYQDKILRMKKKKKIEIWKEINR